MKCICFLTTRPQKASYEFYKLLKSKNPEYDFFIFIDDDSYEIKGYDNNIPIIKLNRKLCEKEGYKSNILWLQNKASSRDKALYYFNKINKSYKYLWFLEEDVFIPDINTIKKIDKKYKNYDLLSPSHKIINKKKTDWNWNVVNKIIKIKPPYSNSMICAIRVSNKLLSCIDDYARKYKNLFLDEALFNTLSLQNSLKVKNPKELSSIKWRRKWKISEIKKTNLYHPIKNIGVQTKFRNKLNKKKTKKVKKYETK